MSYRIYQGELDTPILRIDGDDYCVEFSVESFPPDRYSWLADALETKINAAIEKRVKRAIQEQQAALRVLAGLSVTTTRPI